MLATCSFQITKNNIRVISSSWDRQWCQRHSIRHLRHRCQLWEPQTEVCRERTWPACSAEWVAARQPWCFPLPPCYRPLSSRRWRDVPLWGGRGHQFWVGLFPLIRACQVLCCRPRVGLHRIRDLGRLSNWKKSGNKAKVVLTPNVVYNQQNWWLYGVIQNIIVKMLRGDNESVT